jgi:hypothetical protein
MARCKICKDKFEAKFFLQKACFNPVCLAEWSKLDMKKKLNTTKKVKDIEHKIQKAKDTKRKKELMTRTQWFTKLKTEIHRWIVHVRDKDKGCYTCGKTDQSVKYDAGHRHHAGRGGGDRRRFIPENIHKQCSVNCNQHGSGMPVEYDIALDIDYGEGFAEYLSCEANYPTLKELFPTWQDIELEIIRYRKLLKDAGV